MHDEKNSKPLNVSDDSFQKEVLESDLPVVVDFWAPWCGPCRMVAPILDELAGEFAGKLRVAKVNTDENQRYAAEYRIMGIPTMIFFHKGEEVGRIVGALPKPELKRRFEGLLSESLAA